MDPWWTQCIFASISSADRTIYHYSISAHNKLWFHYSVRPRLSISWDDVTLFSYSRKGPQGCRCVFCFVRLLWRSLFCLFWWWLNFCQERKKNLKYRNLNAHVFLSWFQTSESPPTSHICTAIYTCLVSCSLRLLPLVGEPIDQSELYRWRMVMPSFFIFSNIPWYIHERWCQKMGSKIVKLKATAQPIISHLRDNTTVKSTYFLDNCPSQLPGWQKKTFQWDRSVVPDW